MRLAVLFSGGKDSTYAAYLAKKQGHELTCLISIFSKNKESFMFHTPSIKKTSKQAEVMGIPLLVQETEGEKELELLDLEKAIKKAIKQYKIEGIITGALASVYQASRIQAICDKLKIHCINPLWGKKPEEYWEELLKSGFKIIIIGVAAEGLDEKWLGKEINNDSLQELKKLAAKYHFHLCFEGGEAETFVLDCPLFTKAIKIRSFKQVWEKNSGVYTIKEVELIDK